MRTAAGVVFFLLILLRGAVAGGSDPALQSDRPIRVVDRLSVNTSNTERYVVFRQCEREGVRHISTLLKQSNTEEMWAFLPRGRPSGYCQWHELGRNEQPRFYQAHPRGDDIRNKVVTPNGIADYALTDAGRAKYDSDKDARTRGLYIEYDAASALGNESIEGIVAEHPDDFARSMGRFVEALNTKYLRVVLAPFLEY